MGRTLGVTAVTVWAPQLSGAKALAALHNLVWRQADAGLMPEDCLAARDDAAAGERWKAVIAALDADGREASGRRTLVAVPLTKPASTPIEALSHSSPSVRHAAPNTLV